MATVTKEKLHCEIGNHNWSRELGKRGRKPTSCPKHTVVKPAATSHELYCEAGKHKWTREPTRGRVPVSCPEHRIVVVPSNNKVTTEPNGMVILHCEIGNHDWEREPKKGRKPVNCPAHKPAVVPPRSVPVVIAAGSETGDSVPKRKPGRPRVHETPEEAKEAQLEKSRERAKALDERLKLNGVHISQNYILYKKAGEKPSRNGSAPATTWQKVEAHTALQSAQYVNAHEADFKAKNYRYEKDGKVLDLL